MDRGDKHSPCPTPTPQTQAYTNKQKLALSLIEDRQLSHIDAARELGFKDPETTGRVAFSQLVARARKGRLWRREMIENCLEPR